MSVRSNVSFYQGMICAAAVLSTGNISDVLGCCGKIDWSKIERGVLTF